MSSAFRERTREFFNIVSSQNEQLAALPTSQKPTPQSQFASLASVIAGNLTKISGQLDQMTQLVKSQGTIGDSSLTVDVQRLSHSIRQNMSVVGEQMKQLGTVNTSSLSQEEQHKKGVISQLNKQFRTTSQLYKTTLESQSQTLQRQNARRDRFQSSRSRVQLPPTAFEEIPETQSESRDQSQQQSQMMEQSNTMADRRQAVQSIETHLTELAQLFSTFNSMVAEQGDAIIHIERNVDDAFADVQGAQRHIERIWERTKNDRALLLKIFGLIMIFVVVFGFVL
ncbi:hypothetical protein P9112_008194 [Eukaryota sp. TZLM1-RC]